MDEGNVYIRFYFYIETLPSNTEQVLEVLDVLGAVKTQLRLQSDGYLRVVDSIPSAIVTSSVALSVDTWYRIELRIPTGNSIISLDLLKVDGVVVGSAPGNFGSQNTGSIRLGKATNINGSSVDFYYDDVCLKNDTWPGEGVIKILRANEDGTYTSWLNESGSSSNNFLSVDDIPHDSNTTYVTSSTNNEAETFGLTALSTSTGFNTAVITAVKAFLVVSRTGLPATFKLRVRSGGFNSDSASIGATLSYAGYGDIHEFDPNTLDDWTISIVDNMEVGIVHATAATREIRLTAVNVFVDYIPNLQSTADLWQVNFIQSRNAGMTVNHIASADMVSIGDLNNIRGLTSVVATTTVDFHTIASINNNGGYALSSSGEFCTISNLNSMGATLLNSSAEIHTTSHVNNVPRLSLVTDVSFNNIVSVYSDGYILGQVIAQAFISSISSINADDRLTVTVTSDLQTISSILQTPQASKVAFSNLDTIANIDGTAKVSVQGTASFIEITELASTAGRIVGNSAEFSTISSINNTPRVLILSVGGLGTISDVALIAVVTSLQNTCEFQTVTQLDLTAMVQRIASSQFETIGSVGLAAGKIIVATGDFQTTSDIISSAQITIGAISVGEFFTVSNIVATPKLTFRETARFQTIVSVLGDGDSVPTVWEQRNMAMVMEIRPDLREVIGEVVNLTLYVTPAYRD